MSNVKQQVAKRMKMHERAQVQLELHFPTYPQEWLWHRTTRQGFTTIPRTLPLAMQVIDAQSKGQPAGHTLFCLWTRYPDNPLIIVENPSTFASEAGFFGERAVDTWRRRMKKLRELGFIRTKSGPSGDFHYVMLINPNAVVEFLHRCGMVQTELYARFIDRLSEIGGHADVQDIRAYWDKIGAKNAQEGAPPGGQTMASVAEGAALETGEDGAAVEGGNGNSTQATNEA